MLTTDYFPPRPWYPYTAACRVSISVAGRMRYLVEGEVFGSAGRIAQAVRSPTSPRHRTDRRAPAPGHGGRCARRLSLRAPEPAGGGGGGAGPRLGGDCCLRKLPPPRDLRRQGQVPPHSRGRRASPKRL